jgi:hypothetical protein
MSHSWPMKQMRYENRDRQRCLKFTSDLSTDYVLKSVLIVERNINTWGVTKHIAIRYHFLRDHQQKGNIKIAYINTKDQLADIFTKPLDEKTFTKLRNELNILDSRKFDWYFAHIAHLYTFDHISFMSTTNVFSSVILCLVIELKGKWSIRQRRRFHSTPSVLFTLCRYSASCSTLV